MADTLDKRVADLEQMIARIPEDLDARFAGVDVKLASIREVLALHTTRFTTLEARLTAIDGRIGTLERTIDSRFAEMCAGFDEILQRLPAKP